MSQKQNALLSVSALFAKINDNYSKLSYDDAEFRSIRQEVDAAIATPEAVAPPPVVTVQEVVVPDPAVSAKVDSVLSKLESVEVHLGAIMHMLPEPATA